MLESAMLRCCRVIGRHTSDNIVHWYEEIVADFSISLNVRHVVTDSGANIKKACQSLALPGFEEESSSNSEEEEDKIHNSSTTCTIHETIESDSNTFPLQHHPCFAHTLQLVVKDGLAKAGSIGTIIKKCFNLVSFVRKSTTAADVLREENKLQANNTTRWNSQLKMIKSVLSLPK